MLFRSVLESDVCSSDLRGGLTQALDGAELLEQRRLAGGAEPGDGVEHGAGHALGAPSPVVDDEEAVGLFSLS